jgi:hypothetical protein
LDIKEVCLLDKFKEIVKKMAKYHKTSLFVAIVIQIFSILLFYTTKFLFAPIAIILALLPSAIYFILNPIIEEDEKKDKFLSIYQISMMTSAAIIVNIILKMIIPTTFTVPTLGGTGSSFKNSPLVPICFFVDFIVIVFLGFSIREESASMFMDNLKEVNLWNALGIHLFDREQKEGDIVLCRDIETDRPIIIPYKDRFLHMLILGPTGSGKTSQTIMPMLNQDVQNLNAGITVIEPKGDLAEKIYAMAQYYGRPALYFNPVLDACPTFNPLYGKEEDVVENTVTTFKMLDPDSPQYFQDMNEQLLRNSLKVLKRLKGNTATMIDLSRLVSNSVGEGRKMVMAFSKKNAPTEALAKENADIANYFLSDYFNEKSKTYDNTSGVRSQIAKVVSNKFLRKVLNPENGKSDIDFDEHLENGTIICISTAQGKLRDLSKFLGYFIILNFQSSVFKRPGNENTRKPHFLYIDEFQEYATPGFAQMLTQGRSYRVASHLATQNRALMGMGSGKDGDDFIELVSTNARNIVIYPGGNYMDAKFYSDQFGEIKQKEEQRGITRQRFHPLYGNKVSAPSESVRVTKKDAARFSPTDIIYRKFGEITYAIIQDNTLQIPGVGKISYIPTELNRTLDTMIEENNMLMALNFDPNLYRDFNDYGKLFEEIDMDEVRRMYEVLEEKERRARNGDEDEDEVDNTQSQASQQYTEQTRAQTNTQTSMGREPYVPPVPQVDVLPIEEEIIIEDEPAKNNKASQETDSSGFIDDDII